MRQLSVIALPQDKKEDEGTNNFNAKVNVDADIINMAYYKSGGFAVLAKAGTELQLLSMPSGEVVQVICASSARRSF